MVRYASFLRVFVKNMGRSYSMILDSSSRWSTTNLMFKWLLKVKEALVYLAPACVYERDISDSDLIFKLLENVNQIGISSAYWKNVDRAVLFFDSVCQVTALNEAKLLYDGYYSALFAFRLDTYPSSKWLSTEEKEELDGHVQSQALPVLTQGQYL